MSSDSLIRALPDLVIGVRRDGVILALNAGNGVGELKPTGDSIGKHLSEIWPEAVAELVKQLTRKAISTRDTSEARFRDRGCDYEARASAQGPDRAICIIRPVARDTLLDTVDSTAERLAPQIDRRGFLRRFKESTAMAALREKPLAVAIVHIEGLADIAQAIAPKVSEQLMTTAVTRLSANSRESEGQPSWYLGQLSDSLLALVLDSADRESIEVCVEHICASLREPVQLAGDVYQLTPSAGVALLGQDASSAKGLLDHARAAVNEARRGGGGRICFFTDTLRLKSLARLDIARELHNAIASREIQLRYVGRHDLATGRLVAWVGYLRWLHPLRGEIRPLDFLRVAETTGLGTTLSRAAMKWLQEDFAALSRRAPPDVRISFGALRHHLSHEEFVEDFGRLLTAGIIPAQRLELRISERNLGVRPPSDLNPLATAGVQLIVDEVGRGTTSPEWLARAPLHGMQLDRAWVVAARKDPVALKVCRASIAIARALDLTPIAPGVDDIEQRNVLAKLGCLQGSGDSYLESTSEAASTLKVSSARKGQKSR
ncbi:MAG TPA: EAL domain-containing protein [Steroidobacteraceae bacterium]|nr:EAL domain-containing protein [Steroidobacteraceae bacterium]